MHSHLLTRTGVGAISYVEYARRILPDPGASDAEINHLTASMIPGKYFSWTFQSVLTSLSNSCVSYWLMFFSVVVHGLSVPALNALFTWLRVPVIRDHPVEIVLLSENEVVPNNSIVDRRGHSVVLNNRSSCISDHPDRSNHPNFHDQPQEESDIMDLRSSGQDHYAQSLEEPPAKIRLIKLSDLLREKWFDILILRGWRIPSLPSAVNNLTEWTHYTNLNPPSIILKKRPLPILRS